jgi:hypothetical protein
VTIDHPERFLTALSEALGTGEGYQTHVTSCLAEVLIAGSLVLVVPAGIAGARDSFREWTSTENETAGFANQV